MHVNISSVACLQIAYNVDTEADRRKIYRLLNLPDLIFSQREIKKITFKGFIKDPGFYFFDTAHYIFLANFLLILLYSYEYFQ